MRKNYNKNRFDYRCVDDSTGQQVSDLIGQSPQRIKSAALAISNRCGLSIRIQKRPRGSDKWQNTGDKFHKGQHICEYRAYD